jgi:hypothetical protein
MKRNASGKIACYRINYSEPFRFNSCRDPTAQHRATHIAAAENQDVGEVIGHEVRFMPQAEADGNLR